MTRTPPAATRSRAALPALLAWSVVLGLALGYAGYHRVVRGGSALDPERWTSRSHLLRASVLGGVSTDEDGARLRNRSELSLVPLPDPVKLHVLVRARVPEGGHLEVHFPGDVEAGDGGGGDDAGAGNPTKPAAKARTASYAMVFDRAGGTPATGVYQVVSGTWVAGPRVAVDYTEEGWAAADVRVGERIHGWVGGQAVMWAGGVPGELPRSVRFLSGLEPVTVHTFKVASDTRGVPGSLTDHNLIAARAHSASAAVLAALAGVLIVAALMAMSARLLAAGVGLGWPGEIHRVGPLFTPLLLLPPLIGLSWEWLTVRVGLPVSAGADLPWLAAGTSIAFLHLLRVAAAPEVAPMRRWGWGLWAVGAWILLLTAGSACGMLGAAPAAVLALGGFPAVDLALHARGGRGPLAAALARVTAVLLLFGCAEVAVRVSTLDRIWAPGWLEIVREADVEGWVGSELDLAAAGTDLSPWTRGEPIPAADGAFRIVCLGGSATQGWSDATSGAGLRPYPELLEDALDTPPQSRRVQVLNQGFAGFNTLHIATYFEAFVADLEPDLVTLYVGYNDLMTRWSATPWRDHVARGADRSPLLRAAHAGLVRIRLLNGLAHLIGYRPPNRKPVEGLSPAVPVDHARDNLGMIIEETRARGGAVLLLSEANLERGMEPEFARYFAMLQELAAAPSVDFLDTAAILTGGGEEGWFSDSVHPTQPGHQRLADLIAERVRSSLGQGQDRAGDVPGQ